MSWRGVAGGTGEHVGVPVPVPVPVRAPFARPARRLVMAGLLAMTATAIAPPARAANHALLLVMSRYADESARLPGVNIDARRARNIARGMGVPDVNIIELRDEALRYEAIPGAFATLAGRIADGDKVFIYYTGHGGQLASQDGGAKCSEGLVSYESWLYPDTKLRDDITRITARASQVVMLNDSCFSGGAVDVESKSLPAGRRRAGDGYRAKSMWFADASQAGPDGAPRQRACGEAVNKAVFDLEAARAAGSSTQLLYVAAAADNEVAWATIRGSVATEAWEYCLVASRADFDRSGAVNGEELRRCAQQRIDAASEERRQTITLRGNGRLPIYFGAGLRDRPAGAGGAGAGGAGGPAGAAGQPAADGPVGPVAVTDARDEAAPADAPDDKRVVLPANLLLALEDLRAAADPALAVGLGSAATTLRIGSGLFDFRVETPREGWLYLLQVGSGGKEITQLFPNREDADNHLPAGVHQLPRASWRLRSAGPEGQTHLLAILSPTRKDLARLMDDSGVFATGAATAAQTRSLIIEATGAASAGGGRYGASAILTINEVR